MTTLHFRAENFEATATMIQGAEPDESTSAESLYAVWAGGRSSSTVKAQHLPQAGQCHAWFLSAERGWLYLASARTEAGAIVLAISLLYSVPGVEVKP